MSLLNFLLFRQAEAPSRKSSTENFYFKWNFHNIAGIQI